MKEKLIAANTIIVEFNSQRPSTELDTSVLPQEYFEFCKTYEYSDPPENALTQAEWDEEIENMKKIIDDIEEPMANG